MKKTIVCFVLSLLFCTASFSYGDVIPSNSHRVSLCFRITNPDEFENIMFIARLVLGNERGRYVVQAGKCLERGYKFNKLEVYWAKKDYVEKVGLKNLEFENNKKHVHQITPNIPESGGYYPNSNPLSSKEVFCKILPDKNGFQLFRYKIISKFNNGDPDEVWTKEIPGEAAGK